MIIKTGVSLVASRFLEKVKYNLAQFLVWFWYLPPGGNVTGLFLEVLGSILKSSHEVSKHVPEKPPHHFGSMTITLDQVLVALSILRSTISWQHLPLGNTFLISNKTLRYEQSHQERAKLSGASEGAFDRVKLIPQIKLLLLWFLYKNYLGRLYS